jgi:hypothetical protein
MAKRKFAEVDLENILENKYCKNTLYTDNINERSFREFARTYKEKPLEELQKSDLNELLSKYFTQVRKNDGEKYQKQSLDGIKYSINRIFTRIFGPGECDIIFDQAFADFRNTYHAFVKGLKSEGKQDVNHFESIPCDVLRKILCELSQDTPIQLQLLVWIYIMIFFCRRGQENIHNMTKETFEIRTNEQHRRYLVQVIDEETKNHKNTSEKSIGGRMYEEPGNPLCPLKAYQKYISHLHPNCSRLFQRAKDSFILEETCWYQNRPVGKNAIGKFMKTACKICKITTNYTNHCLRVTSVNILKGNFSDKDIMSISGHTSVSSLKLYERTTEQEKENISDYFSNVLINKTNDTAAIEKKQEEKLHQPGEDFWCDGMDEMVLNAVNEMESQSTAKRPTATFAPVFHNCSNVTINFSC